MLAQVALQIQHLEDAMRTRLHPVDSSTARVARSNTCTTRSQSIEASYHLSWDPKTTFNAWVFWDTHSDCSIYVWESILHATNINSYFYWKEDKYAAWYGYTGCIAVTNGYPYWTPDVTKSPGYTYEQVLDSGSHCTAFDNEGWTDLGPLRD